MTRLDYLEEMHPVPSWIELAIISDALHDREGAERAADELFSIEERIKELEDKVAFDDLEAIRVNLVEMQNIKLKAEFQMLIDHHEKHHMENSELRSENDNHILRIKNLVKANVRFLEVNDKLKADNFRLQKAGDKMADSIKVATWNAPHWNWFEDAVIARKGWLAANGKDE